MFPPLSLTAQGLSRASSPSRGFWSSVWALVAQEFSYEQESEVQSVGSKNADTLRDSRGSGWLTVSTGGPVSSLTQSLEAVSLPFSVVFVRTGENRSQS